MLKQLLTLAVLQCLFACYVHSSNGLEYQEKTEITDLEDLCNTVTELKDGTLVLLDSEDDSLYLKITGTEAHLEHYTVEVIEGKLVIHEEELQIAEIDIITADHPFFSDPAANGFNIAHSIFQGKQMKLNGFRIFGDGTYWEPSFVTVYQPKYCKEKEIADYMEHIDTIEENIIQYVCERIP